MSQSPLLSDEDKPIQAILNGEQDIDDYKRLNHSDDDIIEHTEEVPEKTNTTFMRMELKPNYTIGNFFCIPLLYTSQIMCGAYANSWTIFLLRREDYWNVPQNQIGTVSSNLLFAQVLAQLISCVFIGYMFDLLGRKLSILISFAMMVLLFFMLPLTAPSLFWLCVVRMGIGVAIQIQLGNPLIVDYVVAGSRGKAAVFQNAGFVLGEILGMGVLFQFTKNMDPLRAFQIAGASIFMFGLLVVSLIREPVIKMKRNRVRSGSSSNNNDGSNSSDEEDIGFCEQIKIISARVWETSRSDVSYFVAFFGSLIIRLIQVLFAVYLLIWVTSYVDTGYFESEAEAMSCYQLIAIIAVSTTVILAAPLAYGADNCHQGLNLAIAFGSRSLSIVCFIFVEYPDSAISILVCTLLICGTAAENVSMEAFFFKRIPSDIRGSMTGVFNFFGQIGILIFTQVGGLLTDEYGAKAPFYFVGLLDALFTIIIIVLSLMGYLKK